MIRHLLIASLLIASTTALAQDKPKGVEEFNEFNEFNAKPLEGWEWDDDERLPELVMQLQQKELTLQAIDAKIAKATGKKASSKMAENMAWRSTQRMDLNGGGPVRWDAFYGRNAENFFYHPKDPNTSYHTNTVLQQVAPTSANGVAGNQGVPAHQRPPQFDYIYRGYEKAQSLASACNNGDYIALMDHFTPAHRRRCHQHMEDMFVKGRPKMEIQQVTLLSEESDQFTFAVKYAWHDKDAPEQVYASKVTARLLDGDWKLDGETVRAVTRAGDASRYGSDTAVPNAVPAGWEPFNPPAHLINPNLEHLRGDIGIRPGRGCANGQCGK